MSYLCSTEYVPLAHFFLPQTVRRSRRANHGLDRWAGPWAGSAERARRHAESLHRGRDGLGRIGLDWIELSGHDSQERRQCRFPCVKTETGGFAVLEQSRRCYESQCEPGSRPCVPEQLQGLPIWGECVITGWIRSTQFTSFMISAGHARSGAGQNRILSLRHDPPTSHSRPLPIIHISCFSRRLFLDLQQ